MDTELKELCEVCQRVRWGEYVYLGFGRWRHQDCYPGSKNWFDYYRELPTNRRTHEGDLIFLHATREPEVSFCPESTTSGKDE
jgi:hypothetical protein